MTISIVTISFNSEKTIEDTILSVIGQTCEHVEYIIIDGGSKDKTMEIVNRHKDKISKIISEPDKGIYDAMNKGVHAATGDVVGILNSDDVYANRDVLKKVIAKFEEDNCDAVYSDLVYVDREDTGKVKRYWKSGEYKKGIFKKGWMPPHPTFFVKKKCYNDYGVYNTDLKSSADYELMLRFLHKHEISVSYLPEVITRMRVGGESNVSLKNRIRANKEDRLAWKLNGLKPGPLTLTRKPLSKISQFFKNKG